jgi:hypothetical protein
MLHGAIRAYYEYLKPEFAEQSISDIHQGTGIKRESEWLK